MSLPIRSSHYPAAAGQKLISRCNVIASIARDEAATLELPHVVHIADPFLDVPLAFGPFEGPVLAAAFIESYLAGVIYDGCDDPPAATIVPLRHT